MAQTTWRSSEDLAGRVRSEARRQGRSVNEFITAVMDAATNPELTDDASQRVRERLARAGLLAATGPPRTRPPGKAVARARAAAGRGQRLSDIVTADR